MLPNPKSEIRNLKSPLRLRVQLAAITFCRTVFNTAHRMVYPFLPTFARGLGVPLESVQLIVTSRAAVSALAPFAAAFSDRRGRRAAMILGLLLFTAAMSIVLLWPTYPGLFAGIVFALFAKTLFDPAVQAFFGDRVPYARRGLAIALSEFSWSGAYLVGIPILGWLIARTNWIAPFAVLAPLGFVSALLLFFTLPRSAIPSAVPAGKADGRPETVAPTILSYGRASLPAPTTALALFRSLLSRPSVLATLLVGMLISMANENVNIVYGAWMENAFGLKVAALAAATAVIGLSELAGEGLVAWLSDRLGKRITLLGGALASAAACLALPYLAFNLTFALIGLFFFYLTFEFTVVASLPLLTEQAPEARATLLATAQTLRALGRVLGALTGTWLFRYAFQWNAWAGVGLNLAGAVLLVVMVEENFHRLER